MTTCMLELEWKRHVIIILVNALITRTFKKAINFLPEIARGTGERKTADLKLAD